MPDTLALRVSAPVAALRVPHAGRILIVTAGWRAYFVAIRSAREEAQYAPLVALSAAILLTAVFGIGVGWLLLGDRRSGQLALASHWFWPRRR